jgi:hypothetical protein
MTKPSRYAFLTTFAVVVASGAITTAGSNGAPAQEPLATFAVGANTSAGSNGAPSQATAPQFAETVVVAVAAPKGGAARQGHLLTFSGPIGIPGASLTAGTYLFAFPSRQDAGLIRVSSTNGADIYALFHSNLVTDTARGIKSDSGITWRPRREGQAPSIASWFPAGSSEGREFRYPTPE